MTDANPLGGRSPERRAGLRVPALLAGRNEALPRVMVADVIVATAAHTGVPRREIVGGCRSSGIVEARHLGIEVAMQITGRSTPEVARRFGLVDHTSVLHARGKMGARWAGGCRRTVDDLSAIARAAIAIAEARIAAASAVRRPEAAAVPGGDR